MFTRRPLICSCGSVLGEPPSAQLCALLPDDVRHDAVLGTRTCHRRPFADAGRLEHVHSPTRMQQPRNDVTLRFTITPAAATTQPDDQSPQSAQCRRGLKAACQRISVQKAFVLLVENNAPQAHGLYPQTNVPPQTRRKEALISWPFLAGSVRGSLDRCASPCLYRSGTYDPCCEA